MKNPDFICIGAQKAGTSWLFHNLNKHPDIKLPYLKELHFFDEIHLKVKRGFFSRLFNKHWMNAWWRYNLLHGFYHSLIELNIKKFFWFMIFFFYPRNFYWYRLLFPGLKNKITGEFTPDYSIIDKGLIQQIKENIPDVKIILLLRDPVETNWSHTRRFLLRRLNIKSLDEAPKAKIIDFIQEPNPLGDYPVIMQNWLSIFPKNQVFMGFYDDIVHNPNKLLSNISAFLNISILDVNTKAGTVYNKGKESRLNDRYRKILYEKYKDDIDYLVEYFGDQEKNYPALWKEKYA